jgi:hypothetical protein
MTLTDIIYQELLDGLRTGLDYDRIRQKHEGSKGPFYNALQRVVGAASTEIRNLSSQIRQLQTNLADSKSKLEALSNQNREADAALRNKKQEVQSWEKQTEAVKKRLAELDNELNAKTQLVYRLRELENMGFDQKKLEYIHERIVEIGTRQGLKPKDSVGRFLKDLKDYDAMIGFQRELQRLQSVAETKRLEAERWRAEKENLETSHRELRQVISAVDFLLKQGIKPEQLVSWSKILQKVGGVEQLESELNEYRSIKDIVEAETKATERLGLRKQELAGEVKTLKEQKTEIEGAIKSLSEYGIAEITEVKNRASAELAALIDALRIEAERLGEAKAEAGKLERELTYARFLTADDEALAIAPKDMAELFVNAVARWCRLRAAAFKVPVPDFLSRKYYSLSRYDEFQLLDLIRWVQTGLDEYDEIPRIRPVRRA